MFNPSILELESQIQYHQEQQELAEQELDRLKMTQAFAEEAASKVEEALEHIDPKYIDVFRGHLLSLFSTEKPVYLEEKVDPDENEHLNESQKKPYAQLTGRPDLRPTTYEDIRPNITYSSDGRCYIGFNDYEKAESFRERLEVPSLLDEAQIMNNHKWELKLYCDRSYLKELQQELEDDWTPEQKKELDFQERLIRTAPDIFYDPSESVCYLGFKAKARANIYGSYLTRILDIAEKYTVTNKPHVTTNTKYELKLNAIAEEDAKHLAKFDLKKDYDHPDHREIREAWRTTRKREVSPACKPLPRSSPLDEIKLGEIVSVGSNSKQYKVLNKVELDDIPHLKVIATYNSRRPALVGQINYLKEAYRILPDDIRIDSSFQDSCEVEEQQEEVDFPSPPYEAIPLDQVELADIVTTSANAQSAYEVTANLGDHLLATCLYNHSLKHREGQKDFWITEAYLVQKGDEVPIAS